uniref:Uncharacterized protein n=1 Tax=Corethron hystrix TaxID=216773 RepID=A0A7S1FX29_9STRA|mmetsp:Transcript_3522/g.6512  ORF Transcript_3522/g.6512 Transcript_3522/m.6512 type:complete len:739 (+) Transcript_3522:177-2393(+)
MASIIGKVKRGNLREIVERINKAASLEDVRIAVNSAIREFSHENQRKHNIEVEKGAATALYKQLVIVVRMNQSWFPHLGEGICHALSMVYNCSVSKCKESADVIGNDLIKLLFAVIACHDVHKNWRTVEYSMRTIRLLSQVDSVQEIVMAYVIFSKNYLFLLTFSRYSEIRIEAMQIIATLTMNKENMKKFQSDAKLLEAVIHAASMKDKRDEIQKWAELTLRNLMSLPTIDICFKATTVLLSDLIELSNQSYSDFEKPFVTLILSQLTKKNENQTPFTFFEGGKFIEILVGVVESRASGPGTIMAAMEGLKNIINSETVDFVLNINPKIVGIVTKISCIHFERHKTCNVLDSLKKVLNRGTNNAATYYKEVLSSICYLLRNQHAIVRSTALDSLKKHCEAVDNQPQIVTHTGLLDSLIPTILPRTLDVRDDSECTQNSTLPWNSQDYSDELETLKALDIILELVKNVNNCKVIVKNSGILLAVAQLVPQNSVIFKNATNNDEIVRDIKEKKSMEIMMTLLSDDESLKYVVENNLMSDYFDVNVVTMMAEGDCEGITFPSKLDVITDDRKGHHPPRSKQKGFTQPKQVNPTKHKMSKSRSFFDKGKMMCEGIEMSLDSFRKDYEYKMKSQKKIIWKQISSSNKFMNDTSLYSPRMDVTQSEHIKMGLGSFYKELSMEMKLNNYNEDIAMKQKGKTVSMEQIEENISTEQRADEHLSSSSIWDVGNNIRVTIYPTDSNM